jgi:hypothetical protein
MREDYEDRVATPTEAVREWARNVGWYPRYKDSQWILSDYDTWERNPHYNGPDQGHPEDCCDYADDHSEESFEEFWGNGANSDYIDNRAYSPNYPIADGPLDSDIPF